jgi:heme-degrading monooxygenase HmoA
MFVRTVYATGDPAKIDTAIRALNSQGRELLEERPGYRGAGIFVDRELGKLLAASWWESEEARRNSDEVMRERRGALLEPFAATTTVENYEAVVVHQVRQSEAGGGLRITRVEFDPMDADLFTETFRASVVPRLETLSGLARTSLLIDRERGRGLVGALFTDARSFAASRGPQAAARHEGAAKAHVTVIGLEEFEVVYADVRGD